MSFNNKSKVDHGPVSGGFRNLSPKAMIMIALFAVMGILWGRVLLKGSGGPAKAQAQEAELAELHQSMQSEQTSTVQIEAVELPEIPGRNDGLICNFFSAENWDTFQLNEESSVDVNSSGDSIERAHKLQLEQLAKRLTLEAVVKDVDGKPCQAFIEGKILSVGQTLTVKEGPDRYVLMLQKISENEVVFSWNKVSVVLKMPEMFEL